MVAPSIAGALARLAGPLITFAEAETSVAKVAGLYAIHGDAPVWRQLGLGDPPDDRPLYVGKAERSLADRDVGTHFATGRTGSSTLRRSLAGLLVDELQLEGRPRNVAKPAGFANFGLAAPGDARLTAWMVEHLRLAVWPSPQDVALGDVETSVLDQLKPPLNLDKVTTSWRPLVRAGRKRLADQARAWVPADSPAASRTTAHDR